MKRKRVIPGTCPKCGYVHGCLNDDLTEAEAQALIDRGYTVDKNVTVVDGIVTEARPG